MHIMYAMLYYIIYAGMNVLNKIKSKQQPQSKPKPDQKQTQPQTENIINTKITHINLSANQIVSYDHQIKKKNNQLSHNQEKGNSQFNASNRDQIQSKGVNKLLSKVKPSLRLASGLPSGKNDEQKQSNLDDHLITNVNNLNKNENKSISNQKSINNNNNNNNNRSNKSKQKQQNSQHIMQQQYKKTNDISKNINTNPSYKITNNRLNQPEYFNNHKKQQLQQIITKQSKQNHNHNQAKQLKQPTRNHYQQKIQHGKSKQQVVSKAKVMDMIEKDLQITDSRGSDFTDYSEKYEGRVSSYEKIEQIMNKSNINKGNSFKWTHPEYKKQEQSYNQNKEDTKNTKYNNDNSHINNNNDAPQNYKYLLIIKKGYQIGKMCIFEGHLQQKQYNKQLSLSLKMRDTRLVKLSTKLENINQGSHQHSPESVAKIYMSKIMEIGEGEFYVAGKDVVKVVEKGNSHGGTV